MGTQHLTPPTNEITEKNPSDLWTTTTTTVDEVSAELNLKVSGSGQAIAKMFSTIALWVATMLILLALNPYFAAFLIIIYAVVRHAMPWLWEKVA